MGLHAVRHQFISLQRFHISEELTDCNRFQEVKKLMQNVLFALQTELHCAITNMKIKGTLFNQSKASSQLNLVVNPFQLLWCS